MHSAIIVALALAIPGVTGPTAPASSQVTVFDCGHYKVKPDSIMISCADKAEYLEHLEWSAWSETSALATGVQEINDCEPSCASGTFHAYPVTVKLDQVSSGRFLRMRITYTKLRPPHIGKVVSILFYNLR